MGKLVLDLSDDSLTRLRERAVREGRSLESVAEEAILQSVADAESVSSWEERWRGFVESIWAASREISPEEAEREAVEAVHEVRRERRASGH